MFIVKAHADLRLASATESSLIQSKFYLTTQRSEGICERCH